LRKTSGEFNQQFFVRFFLALTMTVYFAHDRFFFAAGLSTDCCGKMLMTLLELASPLLDLHSLLELIFMLVVASV
jgi:hypothetical protein